MDGFVNKRLCLALFYLGIVFGLGGWLFMRLQHFSGELYLARGVPEGLVVAPHQPGVSVNVNQRNVPRDLLLFDNPRAVSRLDRDGRYDAAVMPWRLRLDNVEVLKTFPDRHALIAHGADGTAERPIHAGEDVEVAGQKFRVEAIGPWEGLVRHARGEPMATLSIRAGGPLLFLEAGAWRYPDPETAVRFVWADGEQGARGATRTTREALHAGARWGVRDGGAVQWIQGLQRGNGVVLRDGTRVTFQEELRDGAAVRIRFEQSGGVEEVVVEANATGEGQDVYYQNPAQAVRVIQVCAWEEGRALVTELAGDEPARSRIFVAGERENGNGAGALQLGQVMARALPITQAAAQLHAARIVTPGRAYTLREGVVETIGGARLEYRRTPRPPEAAFHLTALSDGGAERGQHELVSGTAWRLGTWIYDAKDTTLDARDGVVLRATRRPGGWAFYLGVVLFAGGGAGWVYLRFRA